MGRSGYRVVVNPGLKSLWSASLWGLRGLGRRRTVFVAGVGLSAFCGAALVSVFTGQPRPAVHDEFAYLLAADTFSRGRLTNPPHPHWEFFETFHVLQQPTYSAKYPPGQGMVLAIGQWTTGSAAVGVWLGVGFAAGAVAWALQAVLAPQWAVLAASFFVVQLCWLGYWAQSFWGGALAAGGGALAFGALVRLGQSPRWHHGTLMGVGFGILAVTRPLEGLLFASVLSSALFLRLLRSQRAERMRLLARGLVPCAIVTGFFLTGIALHNRAVTGSPLVMPYQVYESQYSPTPLFLPQEAAPFPDYRHEEFAEFYRGWSLRRHELMRQPAAFLQVSARKLTFLGAFFLGPGLIALLGLRGGARPKGFRVASIATGTVLGVSLLTKATYAHYIAPITICLYVWLGAGLCTLHRRASASRSLDWSMVVAFLLFPSLALRGLEAEPRDGFPASRTAVESQLGSSPGRDLVFVEYLDAHSVFSEWVYNSADIDGQDVIWARSMGAKADAVLKDYYPDRLAWRVEVGEGATLHPYPDVP